MTRTEEFWQTQKVVTLLGISKWKAKAIERKASHSINRLVSEDRLSHWLMSLDNVIQKLAEARFQGIVVDYDGTLCHEDRKSDPLRSDITNALRDLLKSRVILGVATGRGKSVRSRLREALPRKYWSQVIVGYYNGAELFDLSDPLLPDGVDEVGPELVEVAQAIENDGLSAQGKLMLRSRQITISQIRGLSLQALYEYVEAIVNRVAPSVVRVMRSGHTIDIVPQLVTKLAVVERVRQLAGDDTDSILRIGDRGRWPGNDYQLLASPFGLSSHEVSSDSSSCWNLAPAGHRGPQATLGYLNQLSVTRNGIRIQWQPGGGESR